MALVGVKAFLCICRSCSCPRPPAFGCPTFSISLSINSDSKARTGNCATQHCTVAPITTCLAFCAGSRRSSARAPSTPSQQSHSVLSAARGASRSPRAPAPGSRLHRASVVSALTLWDERRRQLVSFRELRRQRRPSTPPQGSLKQITSNAVPVHLSPMVYAYAGSILTTPATRDFANACFGVGQFAARRTWRSKTVIRLPPRWRADHKCRQPA
jgi:hypothetical protein